MPRLMRDELFQAQLLRTIGYAPYGGADLGECLLVADRISTVDAASWHDEWRALADRTNARATRSAQCGDVDGARGGFLRAANYYRTAGLFLLAAPIDQRLRDAHRDEVAAFRRGAALLDRPPEIIDIAFAGHAMPGYFFRAGTDDRPRPTIILTNGYDGSAEELYFTNGAAALARGYHVLAFDGPGQGAMIIDHGIPFRPDWEAVITPIVDWLLARPEVDPEAIVLMGLSFGGYLAPRAASVEHRLAACISDCGPYDLFTAASARLPGVLARQLPDGNPRALRLLNRLSHAVMRKPTAGWALRRNLLVHGLIDPLDYFRLAPQYSLRGREAAITCPTLVCSAEGDDLSANAHVLHAALTCPKKYVEFHAADAAGEHCESGARTLFHQAAFEWLATVLTPTPSTAQ